MSPVHNMTPKTHTLLLTEADLVRHDVCPVCSSNRRKSFTRVHYLKKWISYDICGECNLVYMNPHPHQGWYDQLYSQEFWEVKSQRQSGSAVHRNVNMWKKAYRRAEKFSDFLSATGVRIPAGGRVLEIGTGYGLIVAEIARHFDCQAFGVEPSHSARAFSSVHVGVQSAAESMQDLADWPGIGSVDLVIFSHVLENVVDLDDTLETLRRMLKPDGLILIETPNIYFPRSTHIYHPYCFCYRSLSRLLFKHGFEVVRGQVTGRPSTVLSPKYLTVLGRKTDKNSLIFETAPTSMLAKLRMQLGFLWYALTARFPLNRLDGIISVRRYQLKQTSTETLEALEASVRQTSDN